jgi:hypothetical protein
MHKWGNFGLYWCGWKTVGSAPARRVYYDAVFEIKKEIPVDMLLGRTVLDARSLAQGSPARNSRNTIPF